MDLVFETARFGLWLIDNIPRIIFLCKGVHSSNCAIRFTHPGIELGERLDSRKQFRGQMSGHVG